MAGPVPPTGPGAFDAAALAGIRQRHGGQIASPAALAEMDAAIRADGRIEASEVRLFRDTSNGLVTNPHSPFEAEAGLFALDRLATLSSDQTLPGSAVTGNPRRFTNPLAMVNDVGQRDNLDDTDFDANRCGSTALAYALCMRGPDDLQRMVELVRSDPGVPAAVRDGLQGVDVRTGNVSRRTFHLLTEGLHTVLKARDPGSAAATGASDTAMLSLLSEDGSIGDDAWQAGPMPDLPEGSQAMVLGRSAPGQPSNHWIIIGHDAQGYYRVDPDTNNATNTRQSGNSVHRFSSAAQMRAYVEARAFDFEGEQRAQVTGGAPRGVISIRLD